MEDGWHLQRAVLQDGEAAEGGAGLLHLVLHLQQPGLGQRLEGNGTSAMQVLEP